MKYSLLIFIGFVLCSCRQRNLNGVYKGLEEMCTIDSTGKKTCYGDETNRNNKWYHLSLLKIKDNKVFMDQSPIVINGKDTTFSASDGGFFYYRGNVITKGDSIVFSLNQVACDNCAERVKAPGGPVIKVVKQLSGYYKSGSLMLNGILFQKLKVDKRLESEHR